MNAILQSGLFEAFAAASPVVYIFVTDMESGVTRWSKNAVEYFDMPDEYLTDIPAHWASRIHPDDVGSYQEDISAVMSGKRTTHDCQYRIRNRYGEYVWVECKGSMVMDSEGKPLLFAGMVSRLDVQNQYDPQTNFLTALAFYSWDMKGQVGTILQINLDEYRAITSTYGFAACRELLGIVADRVKEICKPPRQLYRFSSDEFMIICPGGTSESTLELFHTITDSIRVVRLSNDTVIRLSVSAGAVKFPEDGVNKDEIIEKLDYSLEYARKFHRGGVVFYSKKIADEQSREILLREDLINCIQNDFKGFDLFYQPLVDSGEGWIVGCEALLRWKGDKIQDAFPDEFIKILEDTGYIRQVGFWVMERAMRQKKAWDEKYGPLVVSFNVSYQQFMDPDFADRVIEKAKEVDIKNEEMIIELTESCHVLEPETLAKVFSKLMSHGFKIALDDFGTAYSSMEMLKKLPADYIKIDHSFVREVTAKGHEDDYIIIDELVKLSGRLKRKAILEGVENREVEEAIKGMSASFLQGYHYSRPVCTEEFESLLKQRK